MEGARFWLFAALVALTLMGGLYAGVRLEERGYVFIPASREVRVEASPVAPARVLMDRRPASIPPESRLLVDVPRAWNARADDELEAFSFGPEPRFLGDLGLVGEELIFGTEPEFAEELGLVFEGEGDDARVSRSFEIGPLLFPGTEPDIELGGGLRIGALAVVPAGELAPTDAAPTSEMRPRPRRRRTPPPPPIPRLHPDPGRHTVLVARRMVNSREAIQGSCYRYISEIFARAGHSGWRRRRVVFSGNRNGPYADLSLIRPGDWLYIVNDPYRDPVGTHSVLFVGWDDRSRGYARTISHSGWGAPRPGRERGYDVSRTYRITRPVLGQ